MKIAEEEKMKYFELNVTYDLYTLASLEGKNTVVERLREKIRNNFLKVSHLFYNNRFDLTHSPKLHSSSK